PSGGEPRRRPRDTRRRFLRDREFNPARAGGRRTLLLALIVILPLAGRLLAAALPPHARDGPAALAGLAAPAPTVLVVLRYPEVTGGGVVRTYVPWLPEAGLDIYFRMDGFAWLFALLVTLMGLLVVLYARYYMSREDPVARFFSFLLAFMGAMLG